MPKHQRQCRMAERLLQANQGSNGTQDTPTIVRVPVVNTQVIVPGGGAQMSEHPTFTFYEEYNIVAGQPVSNQTVIAVFKHAEPDADGLVPAITGENGQQHSRAMHQSVSVHYLARTCKVINEARAREVHPEIFHRIDNREY